jgi:DNA-binding PadR family transcriptional regulator
MRHKVMKLMSKVAHVTEQAHAHAHAARATGRLRHGEVKAALLLALQEGPAHGYELGHRLERASGGAWRPSPGSIYPTLQMLADEELVSFEEREGKTIYTLTASGVAELKARAKRGEPAPWVAAYHGESGELREAFAALKMAAKQINSVGTTEQRQRTVVIINEARRRIYELLAQD